MRKFSCALLVITLLFTLRPHEAKAQMPVKAKAFLTIVGYGAAGGAILGAASMAFGTSTRAVAQGASLGLYAGIIFGTYVLVSHHNRRQGSYDDRHSPYGDSSDVYGDDYDAEDGGGDDRGKRRGGFFNRYEIVHDKIVPKERGAQVPPLYINLIQYNF